MQSVVPPQRVLESRPPMPIAHLPPNAALSLICSVMKVVSMSSAAEHVVVSAAGHTNVRPLYLSHVLVIRSRTRLLYGSTVSPLLVQHTLTALVHGVPVIASACSAVA